MSLKIDVKFEVTNANVMRETLTEMGHKFTEQNDIIKIQRSRYPIAIDMASGQISFDSDQKNEVNKIKQQYMINFYRDQAIQEGMNIRQEINAEGQIEIYFTK